MMMKLIMIISIKIRITINNNNKVNNYDETMTKTN